MHADCSEILQPKEFLFPIQIGTVFTMLRKYAISSSACAHTPILIKGTYWSKYESVYITAQHLWCCNLLIILLFYHTVSFIVPPQSSWNPINSTTAFYIVFHFAMPWNVETGAMQCTWKHLGIDKTNCPTAINNQHAILNSTMYTIGPGMDGAPQTDPDHDLANH